MPIIAVDTSVIIEYIDKAAEFHNQANAVFSAIINNEVKAIIPHQILAETYYVSAKIYQKLGIRKPQSLSAELVEWLFRLPSVSIPAENRDLAIEAGAAKYNFCIALTDCYVLGAAKIYNAKALFKKPEAEMLTKIGELKKTYQLVFLSDYK
jgi:predicted nucleic acid-binding protein